MENWKDDLQNYLPDVEEFLTSVLLEETNINIASAEAEDSESVLDELENTDIVLFARDEAYSTDFIIILDQEWYGLLSSIMLGVEEKTNNEVTRDLLKKFSGELATTLLKKLESNGLNPDPGEIEVTTAAQLDKHLAHHEYFRAKLEVEGLADNRVRAEVLLGNPEALNRMEEDASGEEDINSENNDDDIAGAQEQEDPELHTPTAKEDSEEEFSELEPDEMGKMGQEEEVITGRHIEFEDFDDSHSELVNGDGRSMELLKDVEMDLSVELGRIELPLGKVLQLAKGSVVELEKLAGEPVDILVNGHCIAHGEVVVIDEHFGVRITNLITTRQRLANLK